MDTHLNITHTHTPLVSSPLDLITTPASVLTPSDPSPSPCVFWENECQNGWDGNGVEKETDKEASGNVEQLWAKIDKLHRGLSDPGLEPQQTNLTDMGAAPGNGENSLRVPVSQPEKDNVTAIAEKWFEKYEKTQTD